MCKSGKSLLRWLTFKRAHQSPGHLTHLSFSHWAAGINFDWLRISVYQVLSPYDDVNVCLIPDHVSQHTLSGLWTQGKCVMMCCLSSHVVQLCAGCDWILAACQYPLVVWNYCKRKETPWWLRALSSTHDWDWGLPPLMILTGHNLSPIEKLFWTSIKHGKWKTLDAGWFAWLGPCL